MDQEKLEITQKTAKQIKYFRTMRGLSQESLALTAGLNPAFLGHIERSLKCPTIDTLNKIASALDVSLSQLLDFEGVTKDRDNEMMIERIAFSIRGLSLKDVEQIAEIVDRIVKFKQESEN